MDKDSPLVITISRQLGSGGAYVGQALAKTLGISYADREVIDQAAQKLSMLDTDLEKRDEKRLSFWQSFMCSLACAPEAYVKPQSLPPTDRELFKIESEIMIRIALERSVVIIGRCGTYVLKGHPRHVSIFLHADNAFRQSRLARFYGISADEALKMIAQSDKEREIYHRTLTGEKWTDASRYDLVVNTGKTGLEGCAGLILKYLEIRK